MPFPGGSNPKGGHSQLGTGERPWLWIPSSCRKPRLEVGIHSRSSFEELEAFLWLSQLSQGWCHSQQSPGTSGLGASRQREISFVLRGEK